MDAAPAPLQHAPGGDEHQLRPTDLPAVLHPPLRFGLVGMSAPTTSRLPAGLGDQALYRGAYPRPRHAAFLRTIGIRTMVSLTPKPLRKYAESDPPTAALLRDWVEPAGVALIHVPAAKAKEREDVPLSQSDLLLALRSVLRADLGPVYVHDLDGDSAVPLLVGALRRIQGWSSDAIKAELQRGVKPDASPDAEPIPSSILRCVFDLGTGPIEAPPPAVPYPAIELDTEQLAEDTEALFGPAVLPPVPLGTAVPPPPFLVLPRRSSLPRWLWPAQSGVALVEEDESGARGRDPGRGEPMRGYTSLWPVLANEEERSLHWLLDPWAWHGIERGFALYWSARTSQPSDVPAPGAFPDLPTAERPSSLVGQDPSGRGRRRLLPEQPWTVTDAARYVAAAAEHNRLFLPVEHPYLARIGFDPEDPAWYLAHPMSFTHALRPELVARLRSSSSVRTHQYPPIAGQGSPTSFGPTRRTRSTPRLVAPEPVAADPVARPKSILVANTGAPDSPLSTACDLPNYPSLASSAMAAAGTEPTPAGSPRPESCEGADPAWVSHTPPPTTLDSERKASQDDPDGPKPLPGAWPSPAKAGTAAGPSVSASATSYGSWAVPDPSISPDLFSPVPSQCKGQDGVHLAPAPHTVRPRSLDAPPEQRPWSFGSECGSSSQSALPGPAGSPQFVSVHHHDEEPECSSSPAAEHTFSDEGPLGDLVEDEEEDEEDEEDEEPAGTDEEEEEEEEHDDRVLQALDLDGY